MHKFLVKTIGIMPKRHGKKTAVLSICILFILPSVIINNKDLPKHSWFATFMHIFCKNDWNNFLLLNTYAPFNITSAILLISTLFWQTDAESWENLHLWQKICFSDFTYILYIRLCCTNAENSKQLSFIVVKILAFE